MNGIVRNLLLPWYNAYRFLVQNVARMESTCSERLQPSEVRVPVSKHERTRKPLC